MSKYPSKRNKLYPGMKEKLCLGPCESVLPLDAFPVNNVYPDGRGKRCRTCEGQKRHLKTFELSPEQLERKRARSRAYYQRNKNGYQERGKRYHTELRQEVLDAYGRVCACCGETTEEFLGIDHIENDGAHERKQGGRNFYLTLKERGFPKDRYQVLCHNCNTAKKCYGQCPHERQRREQTA